MIISVTAQKGGVGKTTLATNLASSLQGKGFNTLAIDIDAQRNTTQVFTTEKFNTGNTIFGVLTGETNINDAIYHAKHCDLIPSHKMLYNIDSALNPIGKELKLKRALKQLKVKYDYIIIDTPPYLNTLVLNALACCDKVLMPIQADYFSLQAITEFYNDTFVAVKEELNKKIQLLGFVLMMYNDRTNLGKQLKEDVKTYADKINSYLFDTTIRQSTILKESQFNSILSDYAPTSNVAKDFEKLTEEFILITNNKRRGVK